MKKTLLWCGLFGLFSGLVNAQEPLKQEGKKTLYQRVLSTPECKLSAEIGGEGNLIPTFSRYYVYARESFQGNSWLKVGSDTQGKTVGWLPESCAVPWNMQMTMTFTNPAGTGRDSLLFFKDRASLEKVIDSNQKASDLATIRAELGVNGSSETVVSQEPKEFVNFQNQFYLLPVLQGEEVMNSDGLYERILEVASVTKPEQKNVLNNNPAVQKEFSAAIVFVVDASISMDPYLARTKEAIRQIYTRIESEGLGNEVKFGLVAFRSNTKAVPALEFTTRIYADPNEIDSGAEFLSRVADLKQAKVSSSLFDEDAYAGIDQALNEIDWSNFDAKYMVLITDAGAIEGDHKLSSTGLNAPQLRLEAENRNIQVNALHLKTKQGAKNHASAEAQYKELTWNKKVNELLYYPVNAGDVFDFGAQVDGFSHDLVEQVLYAKDKNIEAMEAAVKNAKSERERNMALLGKAMYMEYLGKIHGSQAPSVFKAWISDRDFIKQDVPTAEVRVLLTKSQLSDLAGVVKQIANAGNEGLIAPNEMFNQLRSVAAAMGQDPEKIKSGSSTSIAELGLLGEYLDGLPYRSQITGIDEETWKSMGVAQQEKFVQDLNRKLTHYKRFNEDVDRWISLSDNSDPKDFVYPVPLEALP